MPLVEGLVTNNYKMLRSLSELAAICSTHLTIVAIQRLGDDATRASGAILLDLPGIMRRRKPGTAQVSWMRPRDPAPQKPWDVFKLAAVRAKRDAVELYDELRVTTAERLVEGELAEKPSLVRSLR
ncbi:MAG: hypothetical protein WCF24_06125 [Acidimicrobiales bacterium]